MTTRRDCPECGGTAQIRRDGTLAAHREPGPGHYYDRTPCPGPAPVGPREAAYDALRELVAHGDGASLAQVLARLCFTAPEEVRAAIAAQMTTGE